MAIKKLGKTGSPPFLQLVDSLGVSVDLGEIKTGSKFRNETIKTSLSNWMANNNFEPIRDQLLDLAIIIKVSPYRYKNQDIDNIAKVVCDALKQQDKDDRFLYYDDSQVVRLLIWKIQRVEDPLYNTDGYDISFRIHDSDKQMILYHPETGHG